jgi:cytochrome c biogenesis protein CcmG, thiol:disulfide interchange protein DsbE
MESNEVMERRDFLKIIGAAGLACIMPRCQSGPLPVGATPGNVDLVDVSGRRVALPKEFHDKVLVIHFWTSSCSLCVGEMRILESLHRDPLHQDVAFCSVNVGDPRGPAERYLQRVDISYPVLLDEASATRTQYRILGVPTTYILDRKGVVRFMIPGPVEKENLKRMIGSLL